MGQEGSNVGKDIIDNLVETQFPTEQSSNYRHERERLSLVKPVSKQQSPTGSRRRKWGLTLCITETYQFSDEEGLPAKPLVLDAINIEKQNDHVTSERAPIGCVEEAWFNKMEQLEKTLLDENFNIP
ncbi:hypothetical protein J6590_026684 [Homalodisca vitripennis]|nr:hypothetical protein J6590_026684 [Homalodisca vitripennis]